MKQGTLSLWLCLCILFGMPMLAHAAPLYTLKVVGVADSAAYDVNGLGQVAGVVATADGARGFFYDGVTFNALGTLGGASSVAWRLNDSGTVVGTSSTAGSTQGFVYSGGVMSGLPGTRSANDINAAGVVTGYADFPNGSEDPLRRAYTYDNGVLTNLGTLPGAEAWGSEGQGINNAGQVAGTAEVEWLPTVPLQPFLYSNGVMQDLGNFGGVYSNAWAINDLGQVVGSVGLPSNDEYPYVWHAFL